MVKSKKPSRIVPAGKKPPVKTKQREHIRTYRNGNQVKVNPGNKKPARKSSKESNGLGKRPHFKFWGDKDSGSKGNDFRKKEGGKVPLERKFINYEKSIEEKTGSGRKSDPQTSAFENAVMWFFLSLHNSYHGELSSEKLQKYANLVSALTGMIPADQGINAFQPGEIKNHVEKLRESEGVDKKTREALSMIEVDTQNYIKIEGLEGKFTPVKLVALGYFCLNELTDGQVMEKKDWNIIKPLMRK